MPASYPNSVKVFTTKTTGQTILASHINEPQDEITAIEQGLLQGLAHALFPNTDAGQDLGTTTKRWRQLLVQKIATGITGATKIRIQEVGTSTWVTVNADFDGTNWNREDTAQPAQAIEINSTKEVKYYRAAAGANPITWTNIFTISTDRIAAPQAVIGTDPGGTETLRAQTLRAGNTTLTAAVVGTDPGGTETLRAQNLRAGTTTITGDLAAPTAVIGTDPGGTESLRAQDLRAGPVTITGNLSAPTAVIGTDPGGTEVLRAQNLRAGGGIFSDTFANTSVVGSDPGGTESLRAGSARLNAPVLLGSVPQFTVAANPTDSLQVATKQYVDNHFPRLINDVTLSAAATAVTITLAETVGNTTPLLIVGECRFNDVDASQVFMRVNGDTSSNYFSAWYGFGVTAGNEGPVSSARIVPRGDAIRSAFWLLWMPVTTTNRVAAGQWSSGGPSGGGVHPQWIGGTAPTSFTFLVDVGSFTIGTRFVIWRLGP